MEKMKANEWVWLHNGTAPASTTVMDDDDGWVLPGAQRLESILFVLCYVIDVPTSQECQNRYSTSTKYSSGA